ncbi:hypothetical protein E2C01_073134 [Portunus trituberculatus]|uniref:Uncharacterized protein n=1 Tax=Portunus trituberculatus TaxID=210409 RepID=A0A5B7HZZ7_PORTR|nr:hypothetical protein [Portunus trituberculatus]
MEATRLSCEARYLFTEASIRLPLVHSGNSRAPLILSDILRQVDRRQRRNGCCLEIRQYEEGRNGTKIEAGLSWLRLRSAKSIFRSVHLAIGRFNGTDMDSSIHGGAEMTSRICLGLAYAKASG